MRQLGWGNRPDRNGEIPTRNEIPGSYRTLVCYCFLLSHSVFEAGREGKWYVSWNTVLDPDLPNLPLVSLLNFLMLHFLTTSSPMDGIYQWFSASFTCHMAGQNPFSSNPTVLVNFTNLAGTSTNISFISLPPLSG